MTPTERRALRDKGRKELVDLLAAIDDLQGKPSRVEFFMDQETKQSNAVLAHHAGRVSMLLEQGLPRPARKRGGS